MSGNNDTSQKTNNRRAYLNDFRKDETGAYVYCGDIYDYEGNEHSLRSLKVRLCASGAAALAALIVSGLIRVPGMDHSIYVLLPYAAALCGSVSICWALGRLCMGTVSLRAYLYRESVGKLPGRCAFTVCCCMTAVLGELIYVLGNSTAVRELGFMLFLILQGIAIAFTLRLRSRISREKWHKHSKSDSSSQKS